MCLTGSLLKGFIRSRSEAIIDGVQRLVLSYEVGDPEKKALLKELCNMTKIPENNRTRYQVCERHPVYNIRKCSQRLLM